MLQETVDEMARNGCEKIVIANGHGGNNGLLQYFISIQLETQRDYVVYSYNSVTVTSSNDAPAAARPSAPGVDGHAGEGELAITMAARPELGHPDRGGRESGANQRALQLPPGVSTAINWYSMYPNHYNGDASGATAARGQALVDIASAQLVQALRAIKADTVSLRLQKIFFTGAVNPINTEQ